MVTMDCPTTGIMRPRDVRECSMDMNSVMSSRRKAHVSTTCCPWVLITLMLCPLDTIAALPSLAGMVTTVVSAMLHPLINS